MFSNLNRRGENGKRRGGKEGRKGRKDRGGSGAYYFSLVCTLYSPESATLKHAAERHQYICILFRCCCVGVLYYVGM